MKETVDYEKKDVAYRPIAFSLLALGVCLLFVVGVFRLLFNYSRIEEGSKLKFLKHSSFALDSRNQIALQASPSEDLKIYQEEELKKLETYGWVDKKKGVVHVPIERAKEALLKEALSGELR